MAGSNNDTDIDKVQGIVILGAPRSGTTMLRRILNAHPKIACPPETYLLSASARFLHNERFAQGLDIGVLNGLGFAGFDEAEVVDRLRRFAFSFFEDHAKQQGKNLWAEKTAFDAFHIPLIRKMCDGHVKYVCLHRHGYDVAQSMCDLAEKTGGYVQELHRYTQVCSQPLEAMASAWVDVANQIEDLVEEQSSLDSPTAIGLRYEELVENPQAELTRLFQFLGEPVGVNELGPIITQGLGTSDKVGFGDWKSYGKVNIDDASVNRWMKFPAPLKQMLSGVCNSTLERLGYETYSAEEGEPLSPTEARRRYEMGLMLQRMRAGKRN